MEEQKSSVRYLPEASVVAAKIGCKAETLRKWSQ
jgi:hypothetical protein